MGERTRFIAEYDAGGLSGDPEFHNIVRFAAALCEAPIALVSLVEDQRQFFAARHGLDVDETPIETSFCAHAMLGEDLFVVPDAAADPRFASNALVVGPPHIAFYAGAPLLSGEGIPLGALCVIDRVPRPQGLTDLQRQGLKVLAADAMARLSAHRATRFLDDALGERDERFRLLADAMPQMVWSTRPDGQSDYYNGGWYEFTGAAPGEHDGSAWLDCIHPDDLSRTKAAWQQSVDSGRTYEAEYRLRNGRGEYRWVLARGIPLRGADGAVVRWFGTSTDVHSQHLLSEQLDLISSELSHRIKNIFSVISGLLVAATRDRPELKPLAAALTARIGALGRAHDLVRPRRGAVPEAGLHALLGALFAPYADERGPRIEVSGEDSAIDPDVATPLALIFHELATNAVKYGALSLADGRVRLEIGRDGDAFRFDWTETGGPPILTLPEPGGFGSRLLETSALRQLGGTLSRDWRADGLRFSFAVSAASLTPKGGVGLPGRQDS